MRKRLRWMWRECPNGKSCSRTGHLPDGRRIVQGYLVTDPAILAEVGKLPPGEGLLIPADARLD